MTAMEAQELKNLVETGSYKPDPSRIAEAMLRRRAVRELLTAGASALGPAGQIPSHRAFPRRAA